MGNIVPKVSIIVPIYNVERYLNRCLDSIVNQTLTDIEIILVDDGSPDNCPLKCDEWAQKDKRIKVIHKQNEGLGFARNSGLEIATGEYVYFVDSDDYLHQSAAEKLYCAAIENNLDICLAGIVYEDKKGNKKIEIPKYAGKLFKHSEIESVVLAGMLGANPDAKIDTDLPMSAWQGIYRREYLENNNLRFHSEREFISEDIIFHLDALSKAQSLMYINDYAYYYVDDNPASLTHRFNSERFNKICILYLEEKRRILLFSNSNIMLQNAQRMFLGNVRVCLKQIVAKSRTEGKKFALTEIDKIVNNETLINVLNEYPYKKNPFKQALMSWLLHRKMVKSIYFLTKLLISL